MGGEVKKRFQREIHLATLDAAIPGPFNIGVLGKALLGVSLLLTKPADDGAHFGEICVLHDNRLNCTVTHSSTY